MHKGLMACADHGIDHPPVNESVITKMGIHLLKIIEKHETTIWVKHSSNLAVP